MNMRDLIEAVVTIALGIIGVAFLAVLVSRKAQTPAVIQASGSAFSNALSTAVSPVTGVGNAANLSYPGNSSGFTGNSFYG